MLLQRNFLNKKFGKKKKFILFLLFAFLGAGLCYSNPFLAAWFGFTIAAYSVIANDGVQTIGTFISSNKDRPWWSLWAFTALIFIITTFYSWTTHSGDVSFERLAAKGFSETPTSFTFLQIAAPIFLLILTRLKMPVSTTFLILSCFATQAATIEKVMIKSFMGYGVAFITAFVVWMGISKCFDKIGCDEKVQQISTGWRILQWVSTGVLWCIWLMQDAANIAVFLPRAMNVNEYLVFASVVVAGLGFVFWRRGEAVQIIVEEKSNVVNVKAATLVDFVYAIILYVFKMESNLPMSTTWVFIGLLAGRELARSLSGVNEKRGIIDAIKVSLKDLSYVSIGLIVSLILAIITNDAFRKAWLGFLSIVVVFGLTTNTVQAQDYKAVSFKPGKGFILTTKDGNYKLETRLRLQILSDTTIEDNTGNVDSKFMMRRARVVFKGHYYNINNTFKLELAVAPRDLGMTESNPARNTPILDWYLGFHQIRDLNVKIGQYKIPFSRERVISSGNLPMVDRSIVNREFTVDRDTGITFFSKDLFGLEKHLRYYAGVYTGIGRNVVSNHGFDLMYVGRIEILPTGEFKDDYSYTDFLRHQTPKLSFGVGYAYIDNARKDKGIIGSAWEDELEHDYQLGSADLMFKYKGLNLHSEAMLRKGTHDTDRNGWGLYGQLGYLVCDDHDIELAARYSGNRPFNNQSTLPISNEFLGGVSYYAGEHPFKIQVDAGKLWSEDYQKGDKKLRIQLQSSF
jgi:hypothetical protein